MKRCLYLMSVLTMIWSLAACGKAVSSHQDIFETEEEHRGFVDENGTIEIVRGDEISVQMDKINVGFAQSSNLSEWQVAQTESFYSAFTEADGYHLNIQDAHGDAARQAEQLNKLIDAPMDVLFIVQEESERITDAVVRAENLGIRVILLSPEEKDALSGEEARRLLETEELYTKRGSYGRKKRVYKD